MKKKILGLVICILLGSSACFGQLNDSLKKKYVGFDANPLLAQILPFNRVTIDGNSFGVITRKYWGGGGIRTLYGGQLSANGRLQFITIEGGYDHRRKINTHWLFFYGFDLSLHFQDKDVSNTSFEFGSGFLLGIGAHWGVEYKISPVVSISTESRLRFLSNVGDNGPTVQLTAPFTFAVHFDISKKH